MGNGGLRYSIYVNYTSPRLNELNPEIDEEDWQVGGEWFNLLSTMIHDNMAFSQENERPWRQAISVMTCNASNEASREQNRFFASWLIKDASATSTTYQRTSQKK